MSVLKIRNDKGEIVKVVALKGDKGESGCGREVGDHSAVFNDYDNNQVLAAYSVGFGTNNMVGYKGYPITELTIAEDRTRMTIVLADGALDQKAIDCYSVGDTVQLDLSSHYYEILQISEKSQDESGNTVLVIVLKSGKAISETDSYTLNTGSDGNWLWVVGKPVGLPITCQMANAVFGRDNVSAGDGTMAVGRKNVAVGNYSAVVGRQNRAGGYASFACGRETSALNQYAFACGYQTVASGLFSAALGQKTKAVGGGSAALGYSTQALGDYSFAMGNQAIAEKSNSVALGSGTKASGLSSFACGHKNTASGKYSVAMGLNNTAQGDSSVALGDQNTAKGYGSHVSGYQCETEESANYSFAHGLGNLATAKYQTVFGKYSAMTLDMLFGIGDGNGASDRRNAFSVFADGHAEIRTQGTTDNSIVTIKHLNEVIATLTAEIESLKSQLNAQKEE